MLVDKNKGKNMLKKLSVMFSIMLFMSSVQVFAFGVREDGVLEGNAADIECGAGLDCALGTENKVVIKLDDSPILRDLKDNSAHSGWTIATGANTACTTTCGAAKLCLWGINTAVDHAPVACDDATADECMCA